MIFFFIAVSALAQGLPDVKFMDVGGGVLFKYQILRGTQTGDLNRKTIIYVNGGPGSDRLLEKGEPLPKNFPPEVDVVLLAPRGTDDSRSLVANPTRSFGAERDAEDLEKLIAKEGLTNFVLVAHSYGSLPARILAAKMASEPHPPRAVLIEGGMVHAWEATVDPLAPMRGYQRALNSAFDQLPQVSRERLKQKLADFKGEDRARLLDALYSRLREGGRAGVLGELQKVLSESLGDTRNRIRALRLPRVSDKEFTVSSRRDQILEVIVCNEMLNGRTKNQELEIFEGALKLPNHFYGQCKGNTSREERAFKASNYPVGTIPFVYVHGDMDPSADLAPIEEFQKTQKNSVLLKAPGAGHTPLAQFKKCEPEILKALFSDQVLQAVQEKASCLTSSSPQPVLSPIRGSKP